MELAWDKISFDLRARREIKADTVRVFVAVTVTQVDPKTTKIRDIVFAGLARVLDGQWSVTSASRAGDDAGMEKVTMVATIRVPEPQTAGLVDRLRKASRAGFKLVLKGINYMPPRKLIDAALRELRQEVCQEAENEAKLLNRSLPSDTTPWRVGSVTLTEVAPPAADKRVDTERSPRYLEQHRAILDLVGGDDEMQAGVEVGIVGKVCLIRLAAPIETWTDQSRKARRSAR